MTLSRKRLAIICIIVLAIVGCVVFALVYSNTTYVRIVDTAAIPNDTSSAPGADVNAVALLRSGADAPLYASAVTARTIREGANGSPNEANDPSNILGAPDAEQTTKYVSLGIGGEITVRLNAALRAGGQLTVYEIGSESGPHAETYEVFVAKKSNGPWKSLGTVAGPHTFVFAADSPLLP